MAWLGAMERSQEPQFHPQGLDYGAHSAPVPNRYMPSGTLVLETRIPTLARQPLDLIDFSITETSRRSLQLIFGPNGEVWIATERDYDMSALCLDLSRWEKNTPVRLSYGWNVQAGYAVLGAENLETGEVLASPSQNLVPLNMADLARILFETHSKLCPDVLNFAFCDHVEPLGYTDGLDANALVRTELGLMTMSEITKGTLVADAKGGLSRVEAVVTRRLPNIGTTEMVTLKLPYQHINHVCHVSARATVMTSGADADYLFGKKHVAVRAQQLAEFTNGRAQRKTALTTRYNLVLDSGKAFDACGLFVNPLRLSHDEIAHGYTALAGLDYVVLSKKPSKRPRILQHHEAMALLSERYF